MVAWCRRLSFAGMVVTGILCWAHLGDEICCVCRPTIRAQIKHLCSGELECVRHGAQILAGHGEEAGSENHHMG